MRERGHAARWAWSRGCSERRVVRVAGAAVVGTLVVAGILLLSSSPAGNGAELRLVRASGSTNDRLLFVQTASLYAKNDPWKAYLASEAVCPGGERTDLPAARQVATVACLVNFARKRRGLGELAVRPTLNGGSMKKAQAIVRCRNFAHDPCSEGWMSAVRSTGYPGVFGENLYLASGRFGAPRVAVDAWLNSVRHRANLFGREWREQGVAVIPRETFGNYSQVSVWVSVLGDR